MILPEIIYSVASNTCPHCHLGKVFTESNPYHFGSSLKMNAGCSVCGMKYEKEPGFFYGALYVNYALSSGIFMVLYFSDALWFQMDTSVLLVLIIIAILSMYPLTYRWGRLFWLNFFIRYDKKYKIKRIIPIPGNPVDNQIK